jgi:ABC-type dipeptide/oligopeptide/nickel transport system permease subunit
VSDQATGASVDGIVSSGVESVQAKLPTVRAEAWRRLRQSRSALISLGIVALYVLVALIGFTGVLDRAIEETVGPSNVPPQLFTPDSMGPAPSLWLGTDFLGRSVLWRFLYGARVALTVAFLASALSIVIGTVLGLLAGYFGRWVDSLVIWLFSTINSVPGILLILALAFVLKDTTIGLGWLGIDRHFALAGIPTIVLAMGLTSWVGLCRYIRGETLKLRERDYVVAARAVGVGDGGILFRHILPNVSHLIIIDLSLGLGAFVQAEVILSFLGLGVTDQPSWGRMIDDAKLELLKGVWWQMTAATVAIFIFSLAVNVVGDALRDALDPRLRGVD